MTKQRLATVTAAIGPVFFSPRLGTPQRVFHSRDTGAQDLRPLMSALWSLRISLIIAALLAVAATPLFIVRRRALLGIAL